MAFKAGNKVRYIGGQDEAGKNLSCLLKHKVYTVVAVGWGKFNKLGWCECLHINDGAHHYGHRSDLFVKIKVKKKQYA